MIKERNRMDDISPNPNTMITNLSSYTLSNDEHNILKLGLSHGLSKYINETETFVIAEDL